MTTAPLSGVIWQLRETALSHEDSGQTDAQLLEAFVSRGEEAAFESLLRRHGPMVLGVCRRVLHHAQDVEDSFQATFLVFVRKAASILPRDLVGNWLYGVAFRTALEARKRNARRRAKEREVEGVPKRELSTEDVWKELLPLLDQELNRLPDPYRLAIVLCDLEGKTHREAAQQLGWPQGTLSSRLVRGRVMLAKRLAKHGMVFSAGILSTMLAQNTVTASVPAPLILSTLEIARLAAAGQAALCGGVSTTVTTLAGAVQRGLWYTQVKQWSICLMLALSLAALGDGESSTTSTGSACVAPGGITLGNRREQQSAFQENGSG
jgi:RNA polymerase sigma factor (sigma-70 family)